MGERGRTAAAMNPTPCVCHRQPSPRLLQLLVAALIAVAPGCSIKKLAINQLGNALSGGGTTFASDNDPELVKAAVPFSLKLIESLLEQSPRHRGLLLAATSGFVQYSYAFVQQEGDEKEEAELATADALHARACRLYLRARRYGLRGLELNHPGSRLRGNATARLPVPAVAHRAWPSSKNSAT